VNPYGHGGAAELTLSVLKNTPIDDRLLVKKFFELDIDPVKLGAEGF